MATTGQRSHMEGMAASTEPEPPWEMADHEMGKSSEYSFSHLLPEKGNQRRCTPIYNIYYNKELL